MRVFCTVRSQKTAGSIRRMITKGVKLMVAENSIAPVTPDHRAGDLQHLANCRAAVDEIPTKSRCDLRRRSHRFALRSRVVEAESVVLRRDREYRQLRRRSYKNIYAFLP